jgi:hypothetical protein
LTVSDPETVAAEVSRSPAFIDTVSRSITPSPRREQVAGATSRSDA